MQSERPGVVGEHNGVNSTKESGSEKQQKTGLRGLFVSKRKQGE
jgi:hypothetical protein